MRIYSNKNVQERQRIFAADEDFQDEDDQELGFDDSAVEEDEDTFDDNLDDMADAIDDMQDQLDEVQEDDVDIEIDNNVEGHLIAECDKCHGIFISAMMESDQEVDKISGICPLCDKESDQYFKWVIKAIE